MKTRFFDKKSYRYVRDNRGFTLVEMIVTIVIISIVAALSITGILAWQDWARFKQQNEYAQTLFIAAQNQLAEYSENGRLEQMQMDLLGLDFDTVFSEDGPQYGDAGLTGTAIDITKLTATMKNEAGQFYDGHYDPELLWPESSGKTDSEKYRDVILSLRADSDQFSAYIENPDAFHDSNPESYWVFELLGSYVYDTSILDVGTVCVEFTPADGQVFSVLYSAYNTSFVYTELGEASESSGIADISDRTEEFRNSRMVGYYGVNSLYKATENSKIAPRLANVRLYNKETLYMEFNLASHKELINRMTYEINVLDADKNKAPELTIILDGSQLKNAANATAVLCDITRYDLVDDGSGNLKRDTQDNGKVIGKMPVLAWTDTNARVHVVLDAADVQATSRLFDSEYADILSYEEPAQYLGQDTVDNNQPRFAATYSFFRFGVGVDDIYVSVSAKADGFKQTKTVNNTIQTPKNTCYAGSREHENEGKTDFDYSIRNARHLYNVRYIEDITYDKQTGGNGDKIAGITFNVKEDIDWAQFQQDGNFFNSFNANGPKIVLGNMPVNENGETINNFNCDFPSIPCIRERDAVDGQGHTVSGLNISESSNAWYELYTVEKSGVKKITDNRPAGFVNVNYGKISSLTLDKITVKGSDMVGGFCGINMGKVSELTTESTDSLSVITGYENVGGIVGFQMPGAEFMQEETIYDNINDTNITADFLVVDTLVNRANVHGVKAVGGILGMVRNEYSFLGDLSKLDGISDEALIRLTDKSALENYNILIRECDNYGEVLGVNSAELKGIYVAEGSAPKPVVANDPTEARYIGGIVGYSYNQFTQDTYKISICECISSPQYEDVTLDSIASGGEALNKKLKGVYVGGIAGYNYFGQLEGCKTTRENNKEGFLFGYRYVGGIVGLNMGPACGTAEADITKQGVNENNVIAYEYAGGITGCNSVMSETDSEGNDISDSAFDPEKLDNLLVTTTDVNLTAKVDNWVNRGVVIATNSYAGGISGYNTGWIYRCNTEVAKEKSVSFFERIPSGDYAGGIAGYSNGILGNTPRTIYTDNKTSDVLAAGSNGTYEVNCYVKGDNYVGGIVGYNDSGAIIEDYEVDKGEVYGSEDGSFVGGFAGLNASIDLLMNTKTYEPRDIVSRVDRVEGGYFVGGCIGGNIINTNTYTPSHTPDEPENPSPSPEEPTPTPETGELGKAIGTAFFTMAGSPWWDGSKYGCRIDINITNTSSDETVYVWKFDVSDCGIDFTLNALSNVTYSNGIFYHLSNMHPIKPGETKTCDSGFNIYCKEKTDIEKLVSMSWTAYMPLESDMNKSTSVVAGDVPAVNAGARINADTNYNVTVKLERESAVSDWGGSDKYIVKYGYSIRNAGAGNITGWKMVVDIPDKFDVKSSWNMNYTISGNKMTITPNGNETLWKGGETNLGYNVGFASEEEALDFVNTHIILYADNGDVMFESGTSPAKPTPTPTAAPTVTVPVPDDPVTPTPPADDEVYEIIARFSNGRLTGNVEGKVFVGGFIGYNMMIDNDDSAHTRNYVYDLQNEIVKNINKDKDPSVQYAFMDSIDTVQLDLTEQINPSDYKIMVKGIDGSEAEEGGKVTGDICVGGAIGYNHKLTALCIKEVKNASEVKARMAVTMRREQILEDGTFRETDYIGRDMIYTYSYAGGIIGKATTLTVIDNCCNLPVGKVESEGTYHAALCEVSEGTIINCKADYFGKVADEYIAGLCGLNKKGAVIRNCTIDTKTISGINVVGGMAADNFGTIKAITVKMPKLIIAGKQFNDTDATHMDGVAGILAAYNGETGEIILDRNIEDVAIVSRGRFVGAVAGINEGKITVDKGENPTSPYIMLTGSVNTLAVTGGFVGRNNASATVANLVNDASVITVEGTAGGIIGENLGGSTIEKCINNGRVEATTKGNAGGITSVNDGLIVDCEDYMAVFAINGYCGGIVALNGENGIVRNCTVTAKEADPITFMSKDSVGGIAAKNAGLIENNTLAKVVVMNYSGASGTKIGLVAGENLSTGIINLAKKQAITDSKAKAQSNGCFIGGVAGSNRGKIHGVAENALPASVVEVNIELDSENARTACMGTVAGNNRGTIENVHAKGILQGNLGQSTSGYGGIAGFSGYVSAAEQKQDKGSGAVIRNCIFDGEINAFGAENSIARVGGIAGINGYGSVIDNCTIGVDSDTVISTGDTSMTADSPDNAAYGYTGGIAGENYGSITACDNASKSTKEVNIISFRGNVGGIVGYNKAGGKITGISSAKKLTVGSNWHVEQRFSSDKCAAGGVIGYNSSSQTMKYVYNYGSVASAGSTDSNAAGLIGVLDQQSAQVVRFEDCINYGNIEGSGSSAGFVGVINGNGAEFDRCVNYGDVAGSEYAGGFVAQTRLPLSGVSFVTCKNHGAVHSDATMSGLGGFIGAFNSTETQTSADCSIYDCVNTGAVYINGITAASDVAGAFVGRTDAANTYIEMCRNYGTDITCVSGFAGKGNGIKVKDCLDDSNLNIEGVANMPFGYVNVENSYYLSTKDGLSHEVNDTYFAMHTASAGNYLLNGYNFEQLDDPSAFLAQPNNGQTIATDASGSKFHLSIDHGASAPGMKAIVLYMWNNSFDVKTAASSYTANVVFHNKSTGNTVTKTLTGNTFMENSRCVIDVPSGYSKADAIYIDFTGSRNSYLRGFTWIPAGSDEECVMTPLKEKTNTVVSIESIKYDSMTNNSIEIAGIDYGDLSAYRTYSEFLDMDLNNSAYMHLSNVGNNRPATITFNVEQGEGYTPMDTFVMWLSGRYRILGNLTSWWFDDAEYQYPYVAKFYYKEAGSDDVLNVSVSDTANVCDIANNSNADKSKTRVDIKVPDSISGKEIVKIELTVTPSRCGTITNWLSNRDLYLCGFAWIPQGASAPEKMAYKGNSSANITEADLYNSAMEKAKNVPIRLLTDYSSSQTAPWVYSELNHQVGFDMSANDPVNETYYADKRTTYDESLALGTNSRINVYEDIDPKFVDELLVKSYSFSGPLKKPVPTLKLEAGMVVANWSAVSGATGYEIRYVVLDGDNEVISSQVYKQGSFNTSFSVPVEEEWIDNFYSVAVYVRAISPDDRSDEGFDTIVLNKRILPVPELHYEVVEGNRAVIIIDNYDEYENVDYDCRVVVKLNSEDEVTVNLKDGYISEPVELAKGSRVVKYYAEPTITSIDKCVASAQGQKEDNGFGNADLATADGFCATEFKGFDVNDDGVEYDITYKPSNADSYLFADITAYNEEMGMDVAYGNITHVSGSGELEGNITDIPDWMFGENVDSILVRSYLYRSQNELIHYGHLVAESIELNGETPEDNRNIIKGIKDKYHYNPATEEIEKDVEICTEQGETLVLLPGYVLVDNVDNTYSIYYNATIALAAENGKSGGVPYSKYAVRYSSLTLSDNLNTEDYMEQYYVDGNRDDNTSDYTKVQKLQSMPVIDDMVAAYDEDGHMTYSLSWDTYFHADADAFDNAGEDIAPTWNAFKERTAYESLDASGKAKVQSAYTAMYDDTGYTVKLYGLDEEGNDTHIASVDTDASQDMGNVVSSSRGNDYSYDMYGFNAVFTDEMDAWNYAHYVAVITKKGIARNGSSSSVLPRTVRREVDVRFRMDTILCPDVKLLEDENGDIVTDSLMYEVSWAMITDSEQTAELKGYEIKAVGDEDTEYFFTDDYDINQNMAKTVIDLSEFDSGETVMISVKAIANEDAEKYRDSEDGYESVVTIPARLSVPDVADVTVGNDGMKTYESYTDGLVDDDEYDKGFEIVIDGYADEDIVMAVAICDSANQSDSSRHGRDEFGAGAVAWYGKDSAVSLGNSYRLDVASLERSLGRDRGDLSGKWIKIALKATRDDTINSVWSDEDADGLSVNYKWIHIPVLKDESGMTTSTEEPKDPDDATEPGEDEDGESEDEEPNEDITEDATIVKEDEEDPEE